MSKYFKIFYNWGNDEGWNYLNSDIYPTIRKARAQIKQEMTKDFHNGRGSTKKDYKMIEIRERIIK